MFTRFFIDRPIFATVLSVLVTLAGGVALSSLPVAQYPNITPPTVEVSAVFTGANAEDVVKTVAQPIEEYVNGVEDMMYMSSTCTNDGTYTLTVTFKPGVDLNIAQVLVQNRVNLAAPKLPPEVARRGVLVKKKSPSQLMIINLYSPDRSRDDLYLSNQFTIELRDELARLPGVGDITYLGQRDYSMRIWLDPDRMAAKGISAEDVVNAIRQQNAQVAAGAVGQPPVPDGQAFQFTINTLGRLTEPKQFEEIILKTDTEGRIVKMKDVVKQVRSAEGKEEQTRIELGALSYDQVCTLDGMPSVALSVYQLPGTNALDTARGVRDKMEELKRRFPAGIDYAIVYDTTPFIDESIREVFKTLRDAVILVAVVMLVFLQSWRAAIIPLAAVPVAIVGTFAAMAMLGYSVNNLTLFGLVLAVGIVVDDAIVVVEAVQHHIEAGLPPRDATMLAMDQVAGPVVAVGLVLSAVFVPCVFISGIVGEFYRQFAVTIAVSTLLSAFNSLTLSPALCALLLRPNAAGDTREPLPRLAFPLLGAAFAYWFLTGHVDRAVGHLPAAWQGWLDPALPWLVPVIAALVGGVGGYLLRVVLNRTLGYAFAGFNTGFNAFTAGYMRAVGLTLKGSAVVLVGYGGLLYLTYYTMRTTPVGFIPAQDKGYLLVNVQLPDAASLARTTAHMARLEEVARQTPGVKHTVSVAGQSVLLSANAPNFGTLYVMLDDYPNRLAPDLGADAIAVKLQEAFAEAGPGAVVNVFGAPPVDGLGTAGGFKLVIEQPGANEARDLEAAGRDLTAAAAQDPELRDVFTGFRADIPWMRLEIDRVKAQAMGVPVSEIITALQVYFGSLYVNDFNRFNRTWQVNVQADAEFRNRVEDMKRVRVKNPRAPAGTDNMVPAGTFLHVEDNVTGPIMVQRYNLYPAVSINATPAPGISSGQAISAMERAAAEQLPPHMRPEWTELAFLQLQTKDTAARAFVLSVLLVFLVLAAQYESWALPLAVILVVPMCLLSAAIGVRLAGLEINIFTQVGFVVLVGLACKNAILIVEFAKQRREAGADRTTAALDACKLRLRPIVMTSVAFIIGVVPLVLAEGAGAEMRHALGTAVFAGMIGVTAFGIFLTPVFFVAVQRLKDGYTARRANGKNGTNGTNGTAGLNGVHHDSPLPEPAGAIERPSVAHGGALNGEGPAH